MKLVIAIPCLNEGETIYNVLTKLPRYYDSISSVDLLVVDDGSKDNTASEAQRAGASVKSHGYNRGLGIAFQSAVKWALSQKADILVTIDGDGQFQSDDIHKLISPIIKAQADFVTASRFIDDNYMPQGIPSIKFWGNKQMSRLISLLTGKKFYDVSCGFRAYSRECLLDLNLFGRFTYTQETFLNLSFKDYRILEIPTHAKYFAKRKSRIASSIIKYAYQTSLIILRVYRDHFPLKFFLIVGTALLLLGMTIFSFFKVGFFSKTSFANLGAVLGLVLMGNSLILFAIGFVSDMLHRMRVNQERILFYVKSNYYFSQRDSND